jgi:hypothetical protein
MRRSFSAQWGVMQAGAIPISGTGTILTSTRKLGPSSTTTPALHSLGMSKDGILILGDVKKSRLEVEIENQRKQNRGKDGRREGKAEALVPRVKTRFRPRRTRRIHRSEGEWVGLPSSYPGVVRRIIISDMMGGADKPRRSGDREGTRGHH